MVEARQRAARRGREKERIIACHWRKGGGSGEGGREGLEGEEGP